MTGDIVKGSFSEKLPRPEHLVKVSRQQAKLARQEGHVNKMSSKAGGTYTKYQRGTKAEKMILADLAGGAKGKKLLVVVDPFMAVADRAEALIDLTLETNGEPMLAYFGTDPREHFHTISKIRILAKTKEDFQDERLSIPGFVPMAKIPAAWVGKTPDLASARAQLRQALSTLTCRDDGSLVIPDDDAVPVEVNDELRQKLAELRQKFPAPQGKEGYPRGPGIAEVKFDSVEDLQSQLTVWKTVRKSEYNCIVAGKGESFDISRNEHAIWLENPSATAKIEIDVETFLFGVTSCKFVQEASGNYDDQSPCSIKLSPGLNILPARRLKLFRFLLCFSQGPLFQCSLQALRVCEASLRLVPPRHG